MTFDAMRTSEHPWTQSHIYQEEQLGCTGDFSYFQPKTEFFSLLCIKLLLFGLHFWSQQDPKTLKEVKLVPKKASFNISHCFPASCVLPRDSGHGTLSPPPAALQPLFTFAYQDPVLIQDSRVFRNMLEIEEFYLAASNYFQVHT